MSLGEGSTHPRLLRSQVRRGERVLVANKVETLILPLAPGALGGLVMGGWDGSLSSAESVLCEHG
jgi:hypothetical protein